MRTLQVELGNKSYPVHIGRELGGVILEEMKRYGEGGIVVITDENIREAHETFFNKVAKDRPLLVLPPGEETKSIGTVERIYHFLVKQGLNRESAIFAVGGGVIGDLSGYAAATYMRGIDFYQVPTSLMGMVDSAIGGKTGVNLREGKNLVGAYHQPKGIFSDLNFLQTLPDRAFNCGMAEVIKYGLIADDKLFKYVENKESSKALQTEDLEALITRSVEIKAQIVSADEMDQAGIRATLNFGHTFGHAIEAAAHYNVYEHGEAVAIGMVAASRLSEILGNISEKELNRIKAVLQKFGLPVALKEPIKIEVLEQNMKHDKKASNGHIPFITLEKMGKAVKCRQPEAEKWLHLLWREVNASD